MKRNKYTLALTIAVILMLGYLVQQKYFLKTNSNVDIVTYSESGTDVVRDELIIGPSGKDISVLIKPYDGEVVHITKETDLYTVKFPVKDLSELENIKMEIAKSGALVTNNYVIGTDNSFVGPATTSCYSIFGKELFCINK